MPTQDTSELKNKIIRFISLRGPSLPIQISKEIEMSTLFTSAFLSELLGERKIKTSNMRVGSSPLYFLSGQEPKLESFQEHIKGKEKEALNILKENKFLKDSDLEPPIRVALRAIKDFAIPFQPSNQNTEIFWRYFTVNPEEFQKVKDSEESEKKEEVNEVKIKEEISEKNEELQQKEIVKGQEEVKKETQKIVKKSAKKKIVKKPESDKFFNKIKEALNEKNIEITDIIGITKNELTLKVKENEMEEKLLVSFNKKRIVENDIIKAHKKAAEFNMKYIILSLGEPSKKITNLLEALKSLSDIRKL